MPVTDGSEVHEAFSEIAWLNALNGKAQGSLMAGATLHTLQKGETMVPSEPGGRGLSIAARGSVKIVQRRPDGRETVLRIAQQGELIEHEPPSPESRNIHCAALDGRTAVLTLDGDDMRELIRGDGRAAESFIAEVARCAVEMRQRIEDLAITPVPRRIAHVLARLSDRFGIPRDDGSVWVPLPLSRQDLADMCATSLETAIRVMSRLQSDEVIGKASGGFSITNREQLLAIAAGTKVLRAR